MEEEDFEWQSHLVFGEESAETERVDFFDPFEFEDLMEEDPLEDLEIMPESVDSFDLLEFELLMEEDPLEDLEIMLQSADSLEFQLLMEEIMLQFETFFQQRGNPASRSFVQNLPLVHLPEVDTCAICMEDMLVVELIKMLPCRHHFHGQCIDPWFELWNTCPVCRYQLPTNNPSEEEEIGYG